MAYHMLLMLFIQVCITDNKLSIWDVWCVPLYFLSSKGSFLKLIRCDQETRIKTFCNLSWRYDKQESETWYLYRKLLCDRKYIVWSWIIRSITIEISWRSEVLWVSFETFIQRLNFCDFAFIRERGEFDGKIRNLSYRCTKCIWAVIKKPPC